MKVRIQGGAEIVLSQANFVAAGGEGEVYTTGSTGIKVYHPSVTPVSPQKIQELSVLTSPKIIKPKSLVFDTSGKHIGHTFDFVSSSYSLCQLFTRSFRDREGVTSKHVAGLIQQLRDGVAHAHKAGILLVDCNETNFLVSQSFNDLYFIDVDSYQTPSFPAKVIMPSVKDWHTPQMNEGSDWFSMAVLAFQLLVGIHPYKGKYAPVRDMEERMRKNISVFHPGVELPRVCYSLNDIPKGYRDWFNEVFEKGLRSPPPATLDDVLKVLPKVVQVLSKVLETRELFQAGHLIQDFLQSNGWSVAMTSGGTFASRGPVAVAGPVENGSQNALGVLGNGNPFLARTRQGVLEVVDLTSRAVLATVNCQASRLVGFEGRVYVQYGDVLSELRVLELGKSTLASLQFVSHIIEHSSRLYPGCLVSSLLSSTYVTLLPKSGESYSIRIAELDGMKIVDVKYAAKVLMVLAMGKGGSYSQYRFRFAENFSSYDKRVEPCGPDNGVNFVVTDSGVVISANEDGDLELSSNQLGSQGTKIVNGALSGGDRLFFGSGKAGFLRGEKASSMRLTS